MNRPAAGRIAYPGLRSFRRDEFDLFFGRESCVDQMVDTLAARRFLAVLGTSGSGKSSLVRTGLLNALELGFFAAAGSNWKIADFRPRDQPIRSLAAGLLAVTGKTAPADAEIDILASFLRRGPKSIGEWCRGGNLPPNWNLILIADQFEELFRYQDYSGREEAEAFVALLLEAARDPKVPIYVVITMRSEYLGACTLIEALPEAINAALYLAPRMTREECRQAIVGPASVCGFDIEPALVNRLLNDLTDFAPWETESDRDQRNRLGRRADQLPLMQHVLNLLWQKAVQRGDSEIVLTLADYTAVGGLGGALNRHADEVSATIEPRFADAIDPVFRSLITGKSVADAVRRPTRFGDLVALANGRRDAVAAIVEAFRAAGRNFLIPDSSEQLGDDTFIDISHESLIRQWARLSRCLADEARSAEAWEQLLSGVERFAAGRGGLLVGLDLANIATWWRGETPTRAWAERYGSRFDEARRFLEESQAAEAARKQRADEDQRQLIAGQEAARRSRQFQRLTYGLAAGVVLAVIGAGAAVKFSYDATKAEQIAVSEAARANTERQRAEDEQKKAEDQRQRAEDEQKKAEDQRQRAEDEQRKAEDERQRARDEQKRAEDERRRAEDERNRAKIALDTARKALATADRERARANEILDTSIALFVRSVADKASGIHRAAITVPGDVAIAGNLLARIARTVLAVGRDGPGLPAALINQLRPALAMQAMFSGKALPAESGAFLSGHGDPGYRAAIDGNFLKITDRLGRVVGHHELPRGATFDGDAARGSAAAVVFSDQKGIWLARTADEAFTRIEGLDDANAVLDIRDDPAADRVVLVYERAGRRDDRGRVVVVRRLGAAWRAEPSIAASRSNDPVDPAAALPMRIAGLAGETVYVVVGKALAAIDLKAGTRSTIAPTETVIDGKLTDDGRFLLVGTAAANDATCATPAPTIEGMLAPWFAGASDAPLLAGFTFGKPTAATAAAKDIPDEPKLGCLILFNPADHLPLWVGKVDADTRLQTARSNASAATEIEIVQGSVPNNLRVLKLAATGGAPGIASAEEPFDPASWGLAGFGEDYIAAAATGSAIPASLSGAEVQALFDTRVLDRLYNLDRAGGSVVAWRMGDEEVQVAVESTPVALGDQVLEILVYRRAAAQAVPDDRFPAQIKCERSSKGKSGCTFASVAFSADGSALLALSSDDRHIFVDAGSAGAWQENLQPAASDPSGAKGSVMPAEALQFTPGSLVPLDAAGKAFLARTPDNRPWLIARGGSGAPQEPGKDATTSFDPIALPRGLTPDLRGLVSDPATGTLYVWGRRPELAAVPVKSGEGAKGASFIQLTAPVGAAAPLSDGRLAVATKDGRLTIFRKDRGQWAAEERLGVMTGLSDIYAVSAANDRIIVDGGPDLSDPVSLRSAGYAIAGDRLELEFVVPWEAFAGQFKSGEVVSVAYGLEVFAPPPPPLADRDLLTLTLMRENDQIDEGGADTGFGFGFKMLRKRMGADDSSEEADDTATEPLNCDTATIVVVRWLDGGGDRTPSERVGKSCQDVGGDPQLVEALSEAEPQRTLLLLRLAEKDPLALAALANGLEVTAPVVTRALAAYQPWLATTPSAITIGAFADGAPIGVDLVKAVAQRANSLDPFDHWLLAIAIERQGGDPETLTKALLHYTLAERILKAAGGDVPPAIVNRRIALSRILPDERVLRAFAAATGVELVPRTQRSPGSSDRPAAGPSRLEDVAAWLERVEKAAPDPNDVSILRSLVEEALGDDSAGGDPAAARDHYRQALALFARSNASLVADPRISDDLREAKGIRDKLRPLDYATADRDYAVAVLKIVDRRADAPLPNEMQPRQEIRDAFEVLATPGAGVPGEAEFRDVSFNFLDFDWSHKDSFVAASSAKDFLEELGAAERFLTRLSAEASDKAKWLTLRARVRFWASRLDDQKLDVTTEQFAHWLDQSIADYEAAAEETTLGLWDRVTLGDAYAFAARSAFARQGDWERLTSQAGLTLEQVIAHQDFPKLSFYRQRLAFDGLVLTFRDAADRLRDVVPLSGNGPLPGEPGFDRAKLIDLAYRSLRYAESAEAARDKAVALGLVGDLPATWTLGRLDDFAWGRTIALLGAEARIENSANGPATPCDTLAAHPVDIERSTRAVGFDQLAVDRILADCPETTPRSDYYRARAISKQAGDTRDEFRLLFAAARAGLSIAYHNIGASLTDAAADSDVNDRFRLADTIWSTYSALALIKGYRDIVPLLRTSPAGQADTLKWLAEKAAGFGIPEAERDLAEMSSSTHERGLRLRLAADLFGRAGRTSEAEAAEAALKAMNLAASDLDTMTAEAKASKPKSPVLLDDALEAQILELMFPSRIATP
jgi:hypothetical protein